jgi:RNA polymerase sigma-70 factor (ECF subfamily)
MRRDCVKFFKKISEYLDGELDDKICNEIDAHLRQCPECSEHVDSLRKTIQLCKETAVEEMPTDIHDRIRSKIRELLRM